MPESTYLDCHGSENNPEGFITPQMRMIVTSWMCEVATEFRLQQETLFLAVALMDRFLTVSKVCAAAAAVASDRMRHSTRKPVGVR